MGIPKRDPGESRPIAIASFFIRALQKTILDALRKAPEDQWCERGVLPATATFLAWQDGKLAAGAELDLAKAYDSVLHGPAAEALRFEGTPPEIVAWLCLAWTAERLCHVGGELADPIDPSSGILPGDPTSGRVLSVLLKPWHSLVKADGVFIGAYADDRSVKAVAGSCTEAAALVDRALATTAALLTRSACARTQRRGNGGKATRRSSTWASRCRLAVTLAPRSTARAFRPHGMAGTLSWMPLSVSSSSREVSLCALVLPPRASRQNSSGRRPS